MTFEEKKIKSEGIYDGKILKLVKDEVTTVNGSSYREVVEHNGGAVICPVTEDGKIILVKQFRYPAGRVMLELPAGKRDGNEESLQVAVRELKEETGYVAGEMVHLCDMFTSPGYSTEVLSLFLARDLTPGETDFDENEAIDIIEAPLQEMVDMVMRGELQDGKTQLGILMVNEYLRNE